MRVALGLITKREIMLLSVALENLRVAVAAGSTCSDECVLAVFVIESVEIDAQGRTRK